MVNALWITLIGMGLVFAAILLLWGLMALLVRLTAEKPAPVEEAVPQAAPAGEEPQPALPLPPAAAVDPLRESAQQELAQQELAQQELAQQELAQQELRAQQKLRRRAAAAGVAFAIALQQGGREKPEPPDGLSAWQSVQRASQLGQRNGISRKVRG